MKNIKKEIEWLRNKKLLMPRMYSFTEVREIVEYIDEENKKETNAYVLQEIRKGNFKVEEIKGDERNCQCDCHLFIGGSGKPCPDCVKNKCWEKENGSTK